MVKHIQTIRRQKLTNCLSVFDHFVGLALKVLKKDMKIFLPFSPQLGEYSCVSGVAK